MTARLGGAARHSALLALAAFACLLVFAAIAVRVGSANSLLHAAGRNLSRQLPGNRGPMLVTASHVVTTVGDGAVLAITAALAGAALALMRREALSLVLPLVAVAAARGITGWIKALVARARPPDLVAIYAAEGYAFPSGHASGTAALYLVLAALAATTTGYWLMRVVIWAAAALITIAVGISRVLLGVHWPADVLAGWLLGAAVALVCIAGWTLTRRPPR